ncbi:MAG: TraR/DksA family transcriptional regulator [Propionibacteriaceae bacterium]
MNSSTTSRAAAAAAASLPIRDGEDPWTLADVVTVRADLEADIIRQTEQIEIVNNELAGLLRDGIDGAGRDPADVGSTNFERDQEMSLAANAREMLEQSQEALKRIDAGTYGVCENCHEPIGKGRLQAYPRANLCVRCKQRQERR